MSKKSDPLVKVVRYWGKRSFQRGAEQMAARGYTVQAVITTGHDIWGDAWTLVTYQRFPEPPEPPPPSAFTPEEIAAIQARDAANTAVTQRRGTEIDADFTPEANRWARRRMWWRGWQRH